MGPTAVSRLSDGRLIEPIMFAYYILYEGVPTRNCDNRQLKITIGLGLGAAPLLPAKGICELAGWQRPDSAGVRRHD